MAKDDGGAAFPHYISTGFHTFFPATGPFEYTVPGSPHPVSYAADLRTPVNGLTKREYYAALVMHAVINNSDIFAGAINLGQSVEQRIAAQAFRMADAMIEEASKSSDGVPGETQPVSAATAAPTETEDAGVAHGPSGAIAAKIGDVAGSSPASGTNYDGGSPGPSPLAVTRTSSDPVSGRSQPSPDVSVDELARIIERAVIDDCKTKPGSAWLVACVGMGYVEAPEVINGQP